MQRRAKIIATLGPSSSDARTIRRILQAGVDIVRLNLSHGSREEHRDLVQRTRQVAMSLERQVPIMLDLMGPRYRLAEIPEGERRLQPRQQVTLGSDASAVDVPIDSPDLLQHLKPGERILIGDGLLELQIVGRRRHRVAAKVISGGLITSRKGINLPDSDLPFEISSKDRADIRLAVEEKVDFLAASYVGCAQNVEAVRRAVKRARGDLLLVAKLERGRAVDHLEEIVESADAVMVARGDLGVEVPLYTVPVLQKRIIDAGCHYGKPVIVATQMLESMIDNPRPTRAEASDVANAVFDGADALLLTGETAIGKHPVKTVRTMVEIITEAEGYAAKRGSTVRLELLSQAENLGGGLPEIADAVARAAVFTAKHLGVRQIVVFSQSGFTARLIARYRPTVPILAFTISEAVARRVQLLWGVRPLILSEEIKPGSDIVALVERHLREARLVRRGESLIILMGQPIRDRPLTNLMRIHRVSS